jgi:osmotically-inducible protein OsmY
MINRLNSPFSAPLCLALLVLPGCTKPPVTPQVSDIDVTEHVKTALQQDDVLKAFNIAVVTQKGDVRLTGVLDNQAQVDAALKLARAAEGAHSIHDELTLKP